MWAFGSIERSRNPSPSPALVAANTKTDRLGGDDQLAQTTTIPSPGDIERLYRQMRFVRRVEEEIVRIYPSDKIKSPVHIAIGQEAISVAVCDALRPDDVGGGSYRSHAFYLAKGGDLNAMMAELYGKATGCAGGKGGSMHIVDMSHNVLGSSAVVGTNIPITAGYALALKAEGRGRVAASFFGDGATEEGCFSETLNFAALHKLPILFVCENNFYAIHEPIHKRQATDRLVERVRTYGIESALIEDMDIFRIRQAAAGMVERLRAGEGPFFLECHTCRWLEHVGPNEDFDAGYRPRAGAQPWIDNDQVDRLAAMIDAERRRVIDAAIEAAIEAAIAFAESSPPPAAQELYADVFAS